MFNLLQKLELAAEVLKNYFTPNQVSLLLGKPDDKPLVFWTDCEMDMATGLHSISPPAYKYARFFFYLSFCFIFIATVGASS